MDFKKRMRSTPGAIVVMFQMHLRLSRSIASSGRGQIPLTRFAVAIKLLSSSPTCNRAFREAIALVLRVLACRTRSAGCKGKMVNRSTVIAVIACSILERWSLVTAAIHR